MTITVEATYENGVLKPAEPLPWKEGEKVRLTISDLMGINQIAPRAAAPLRDHSAFLNSYAPEDEGLYDAYPAR
jgi:predicted DNA-binding antitoxin AbrB/MazE fold protein